MVTLAILTESLTITQPNKMEREDLMEKIFSENYLNIFYFRAWIMVWIKENSSKHTLLI